MKKVALTSVFTLALGLGLIASSSYAAGGMGKGKLMTFNSYNLIGAPVQDSRGEPLGIVNEVLIDSGGHAFAIINHGDYDLAGEGGINTIVPFEVLRVSMDKGGEEKDKVILKTDAEHLDLAHYYTQARLSIAKKRQPLTNSLAFNLIGPRIWNAQSRSANKIDLNPIQDGNKRMIRGRRKDLPLCYVLIER
jgi:hypothetical protein